MTAYEYAVVPAPKRGTKARGVKTAEDRFAYALQEIMNEKGVDGWDYIRTDTLPSEERQGLTGRTTVFQNMMVFRRALPAKTTAPTALLEAPAPAPTPPAPPAPEPTFASRAGDRMMNLADKPLDTDPGRVEPKLRAE